MSECANPSYDPYACCGSDCFFFWSSTKEDPCWGEVEVIGEECTDDYSDCWWIHACQGHKDMYYTYDKGEYHPEPQSPVMNDVFINHHSILHGGNETYSVGGWGVTQEYVLTNLLSDDVLADNLPSEHVAEVKDLLYSTDWKAGVELYNNTNWHKDNITFYERPRESFVDPQIQKEHDQGYRIRTETYGNAALCPMTFCPMDTMKIGLSVLHDAQHDGRSWTLDEVKDSEDEMIENIMSDLRSKVEEFVRKSKPYHCHYFPRDFK